MSASLAPAPLPDAVAGWRSALENLSPHASPCRYLTPARWVPLREAAIDFCYRLGAEAHGMGWTAAELFAVHPEHGTLRVEVCGVLMVSGSKAVAVEPSRGRIRRGLGLPDQARPDLGNSGLGIRSEGCSPVSRRFLAPIGGTGSLVGFTVLVTALAACGLTGLVP